MADSHADHDADGGRRRERAGAAPILPTAVGVGVAVLLLVAVVVIESLDWEFSGIVGLPAGLAAGLLAATLVGLRGRSLARGPRAVADAVAGFGYGVLTLLLVDYVNLVELSTDATVLGGVVAGAVLGVASWLAGGRGRAGDGRTER